METMNETGLFGHYELVTVTPQMAQRWIDTQPENRSIRQDAVRHYRDEYQAGRWIASPGMPLMFDLDGRLRDGQHRLWAIVSYGKPVQMFIRKNVSEEELLALHDIVSRKASDQIAIYRGVPKEVAAYSSSIGSMVITRMRRGSISLTESCGSKRYNLHEIEDAYASIGVDGYGVARLALDIATGTPKGLRVFSTTEIGYALVQNPVGIEPWLRRLVSDGGGKTAGMMAARSARANANIYAGRNIGHAAIAKAWNNPELTKILFRKRPNQTVTIPDLSGGCFDRKEAHE